MFNLITAVLSIMLVASIAAATVSYIQPSAILAQGVRMETINHLKAFQGASSRYMEDHVNEVGQTVLPAPGTNMLAELSPAYMFAPPAPAGYQWSSSTGVYQGAYNGIWVCLQPTDVNEISVKGISSAIKQFSPAAVFTSNACGASANGAGSAFTLWVLAGH